MLQFLGSHEQHRREGSRLWYDRLPSISVTWYLKLPCVNFVATEYLGSLQWLSGCLCRECSGKLYAFPIDVCVTMRQLPTPREINNGEMCHVVSHVVKVFINGLSGAWYYMATFFNHHELNYGIGVMMSASIFSQVRSFEGSHSSTLLFPRFLGPARCRPI